VEPGLLTFEMGTATEAARDAPHGDVRGRPGEGPGRHQPTAGARPASRGCPAGQQRREAHVSPAGALEEAHQAVTTGTP